MDLLSAVAVWLPSAVALRYPSHGGRDDLCQEVLLQIHLGLDRLQDPEAFNAWVHRVLRNCTASRLRSDYRRGAEVVDPDGVAIVAEGHTPETLLDQREAWERGREALASLPEDLREILALFIEEHSLTEIAEMLELPRGTVASRLARARETLQRQIRRAEGRPSGILHLHGKGGTPA